MYSYRWVRAVVLTGLLVAEVAMGQSVPGSRDLVIGFVKTARHEAGLSFDGRTTVAEPGAPVFAGTILRTGKSGSVGIALRDDTIMSIGPDTTLALDEFVYEPARSQLGFGATLTRGTLQYIPGVIGTLKPGAITLRTPTGTVGLQGARALLRVEDGGR